MTRASARAYKRSACSEGSAYLCEMVSFPAGAKGGGAKSSLGFSPIPRRFRAEARATFRSGHATTRCRALLGVCEKCRLDVQCQTLSPLL